MGRIGLAYRALTGQLETQLHSALVSVIGSVTQRAPKKGIKETLEAYSTMPWLRAAAGRVADAMSSVEWRLYAVTRGGRPVRERGLGTANGDERRKALMQLKQAGELREITEHPMLDFLSAGAPPILDGHSARKVTQLHMDLAGEAFWLLRRNGVNRPSSYFPLSPAWIADTPQMRRPSYIVRIPTIAPEQQIPAEEIVWLKDPDPADPLGRGSGIGRTLGTELDTDEYAAEYVRNYFLNDAKPPLLIIGKDMRKDDVPRLEAKWLERLQGRSRAHLPFFMGGSDVEVKELLKDFRSMQFVELRQSERDTIIQTWGVPPEIIGIIDSSNRATIREAFTIFAKVVLTPRLEAHRSCLQEAVVPMFDERLIVDYVSPVPEDREHRLAAMRAAPYAHSVDEWRELADSEPRHDDFGRTHFGPLNVVEIDGGRRMNGNGRRAIGSDVTKAPLLTGGNIGATDDEEYSAVHRAANRMVPAFMEAFADAVDEVSRRASLDRIEEAYRTNSQRAVENATGIDSFADEYRQRMDGQMLRVIALAGETVMPELPEPLRSATTTVTKQDEDEELSFRFDATNPRATIWASEKTAELVTLVDEQTRAAIRQVIAESFEQGIAPRDAARLIRDMIGVNAPQARSLAKLRAKLVEQGLDGDALERRMERATASMIRKRALTIARTETLQAANFGQRELWQQMSEGGLFDATVAMKEWVATNDDRTHLGCLVLDGVRVGVNESFQTEVGPLAGPGLHPACRCVASLVLAAAEAAA